MKARRRRIPRLTFERFVRDRRRLLDRKNRTTNLIAVGAVSATFLGALIGLAQSRSSDRESRASEIAKQLYVNATAAFGRGQDDARHQYGLFVLGETARTRAASALEQVLFGDQRLDRNRLLLDRQRELKSARDSERTARRLAAVGSVPVISRAAAFGPARDTAFPNTFFTLAARDGNRLTALGDAASEESTRRSSQGSAYTVMLTMLTVAVFLFGFALTPEGQENRTLFAGVAASLTAIAAIWSIATMTQSTKRAPDEAARAHADAQIALAAHNWRRAIDLTTRAIKLRPGFARAYRDRAAAWYGAGSPRGRLLSTSLTASFARRQEVPDLQKALSLGGSDVTSKLGSNPSSLLTDVGYETLALGIDEHSPKRIEEGLNLSRQAVEADPLEPTSAYNVALGELVSGDRQAAIRAYAAAIQKTLFTDRAGRHKRDTYDQQLQVSGALTDLEYARRLGRAPLLRDVASIKQYIVGSVGTGRLMVAPPPPTIPRIRNMTLEVRPARVFLEVPRDQVPQRGVSVQWYHHERGGLGWSALDLVSGPNLDTNNTKGVFTASGIYLSNTDPPSCLANGIYRAEVYVNGRLVGAKETTGVFGDLVAATDRDVGYALCRPPSWRPPRARSATEPGLVSGFVSPNGSQGVYVIRVHVGSTTNEQPGAARARARRTFERAAGSILHLRLRNGTLYNGAVFGDAMGEYSEGRDYAVGDRTVATAYGVPDDGSVLGAVVFGPTKHFDATEPDENDVFDSIVWYDPSEYVIPPF